MAADVNYTDLGVNNETSDASNAPAQSPATPAAKAKTPKPAKTPPASSSAAATNNTAE